MAAEFVSCPLCGFEFEKGDTLCVHGCPLGPLCRSIRCPSCEYEFPERPRALSWLRARWPRAASGDLRHVDGVRTLETLRRGERAEVVCLGTGRGERHNAVAVFGLVPGAEITFLQRRPACVVRIGETELALDLEIAREILVRPL